MFASTTKTVLKTSTVIDWTDVASILVQMIFVEIMQNVTQRTMKQNADVHLVSKEILKLFVTLNQLIHAYQIHVVSMQHVKTIMAILFASVRKD